MKYKAWQGFMRKCTPRSLSIKSAVTTLYFAFYKMPIKLLSRTLILFLVFASFNLSLARQPNNTSTLVNSPPNPKTFGRLLTSADERVRMDNLRQSKSQLGVDRQITYRGTVSREGFDWIWLNDQVINARGDQSLFLNLDKSLTIVVDDKQYRLKIGQTLIPALGQVQDPVSIRP